jgi:hypothetical protein
MNLFMNLLTTYSTPVLPPKAEEEKLGKVRLQFFDLGAENSDKGTVGNPNICVVGIACFLAGIGRFTVGRKYGLLVVAISVILCDWVSQSDS